MRWIGKIFLGIIAITAIFLGLGYVTMSLWNWLMPAIFNLTVITFWQAFGLLVLSKILFSGFRGKGGCWGGRCGHGWGRHHRGHWRKRWEEKMAKMSPEERERVMKGMRNCGWYENWDEPKDETKSDAPTV